MVLWLTPLPSQLYTWFMDDPKGNGWQINILKLPFSVVEKFKEFGNGRLHFDRSNFQICQVGFYCEISCNCKTFRNTNECKITQNKKWFPRRLRLFVSPGAGSHNLGLICVKLCRKIKYFYFSMEHFVNEFVST